jgi:hypothetical protein
MAAPNPHPLRSPYRITVRFTVILGGVLSVFGVLWIWFVAGLTRFCVGQPCAPLTPPAYHVIPGWVVVLIVATSVLACLPTVRDRLWFMGAAGSAASVIAYLVAAWGQLLKFPAVSAVLVYGGIVLVGGALVTSIGSIVLGLSNRGTRGRSAGAAAAP